VNQGMNNQRVLHAGLHKGSKGTTLGAACSPLYYLTGEVLMVVPGEKKLMLKVLWEALKRLIDRFLRGL